MVEQATFQFTDPRVVVDASLACPYCLHTVAWEPAGTGAQPAVACECGHCGHRRVVHMNGAQLLRLTIADDDDGQMIGGGATWRQLLQLL